MFTFKTKASDFDTQAEFKGLQKALFPSYTGDILYSLDVKDYDFTIEWGIEIETRESHVRGINIFVTAIHWLEIDAELDRSELTINNIRIAELAEAKTDEANFYQLQYNNKSIVDGKHGWEIEAEKEGFNKYLSIYPTGISFDFDAKKIVVTFGE